MNLSDPLLDVKNLKKYFPLRSSFLRRVTGQIQAVDGISFSLRRGETLGLVGESGCGKSTAGRTVLRLIPPTGGTVFFRGQDLLALKGDALRSARKSFQMIFQDPYASLNPRMTVGQIISEPSIIHGSIRGRALEEKTAALLEDVGLQADAAKKYPFEFSGGQRQRVSIARALALSPELIVADEPVSALDVSVQAQVLNLMKELRFRHNLTYLFISHDLSVVHHISDRVAVMYLGRIVELAEKQDLFSRPLHPYTEALLSAAPIPDVGKRGRRILLSGDVPSPLDPPSGCSFHPRCPKVMNICPKQVPELSDTGNGHMAACHLC
ncbi:MAG: ATP-binding cassette domain-containing protein [Synergistaceae bacterium]|nr:ATP-binding cassette domain-containing protein [Synergistaceae bacterium]